MDGNSPPVLDIWPIIDIFATGFEKALYIFCVVMIVVIIGVALFFVVTFIKAGKGERNGDLQYGEKKGEWIYMKNSIPVFKILAALGVLFSVIIILFIDVDSYDMVKNLSFIWLTVIFGILAFFGGFFFMLNRK